MATLGNPLGGALTAANAAANDVFPVVDVSVGASDSANKTMTQAEMVALLVAMAGAGGRLTLVSATPILTSDQTAKTVVYYTPYKSDRIPIYTGAIWTAPAFTELTLTLNSTDNTSSNIYDVFVVNNAGTIQIGTGPAWTTATAGSGARGTGAGTTELQMLNGILTNKNSITLRNNGASIGTFAANVATYVGSIYCTANGQTGCAFFPAGAAGGGNPIVGVSNAYNRVGVNVRTFDTTASWTYSSTTWRALNASNSNRITYLDGLGQVSVQAHVEIVADTNAASFGVSRNSASTAPVIGLTGLTGAGTVMTVSVRDAFAPLLGLSYLQAMEASFGSTTVYGPNAGPPARQGNALFATLEM